MDVFTIYGLLNDRSKTTALAFLDRYMPDREQSAAEYEFPRFSRPPDFLLFDYLDVLDYLEEHLRTPYALYLRNTKCDISPINAMFFFTSDEHVIYGLDVLDREYEQWREEMRKIVLPETICVCWEAFPPETKLEYLEMCRQWGDTIVTDTSKIEHIVECALEAIQDIEGRERVRATRIIPTKTQRIHTVRNREKVNYIAWEVFDCGEDDNIIIYVPGGYDKDGYPWVLSGKNEKFSEPQYSVYRSLEECVRDTGYYDGPFTGKRRW